VRALGDETWRPLPGDDLVRDARITWTQAITIHARAAEIWPWLVQSAAVGDVFPMTPTADDAFVVCAVEPERALCSRRPRWHGYVVACPRA